MHRRTVITSSIIAAALLLAAGAAGLWHTRQRTSSFYTDAETIRRPTADADVRDILWRPAEALDSVINSIEDEYEPRLSADGLTLFFVRGRAGENADIYTTTRTPDGWTEPEPLDVLNTEAEELGPEPSADGKALYFYSNRDGGIGGYDIWVSQLRDGQWQAPMNLGDRVNTGYNEYGAAITPDGSQLYYASNRPRTGDGETPDPDAWPATVREDLYQRDYDLYVSTINERGIGPARPVDALNSRYNEGSPAVSPIGDFLYFSSDRPGGQGGFDLYRSRRLRGEHVAVENLGPAVNSAANELDPGVGMGGFSLHFSSDRPRDDLADARAHPDQPRYDLFHSTSREVFIESETYRASIDWLAMLPYLLWALLALLLLLLLLLLRKLGMSERFARLSLLAKCLIASLIVHAVLVILLGLWGVGSSLSDWMRDGRGTRVALVSPSVGNDLTRQVRGGLTTLEFTPAVMNVRQREIVPEPPREPEQVHPTTLAPTEFRSRALPRQADASAEAPTRPLETPDFTAPRAVDRPNEVALRLPEHAERARHTEQERTPAEIIEPTSARRVVDPSAASADDPELVDVATATSNDIITATTESLHATTPAQDASPSDAPDDHTTLGARHLVAPRPPSVDPELPMLDATPTERMAEAEHVIAARPDHVARMEAPSRPTHAAPAELIEPEPSEIASTQEVRTPTLADAAPQTREAPVPATADARTQPIAPLETVALRTSDLPTEAKAARVEAERAIEPVSAQTAQRPTIHEFERSNDPPELIETTQVRPSAPIHEDSLARMRPNDRDAPLAASMEAGSASPTSIAQPEAIAVDLPQLEDTATSDEREIDLRIDAREAARAERAPVQSGRSVATDVDTVAIAPRTESTAPVVDSPLPLRESDITDTALPLLRIDDASDETEASAVPSAIETDLPALEESQRAEPRDDPGKLDPAIAEPRAARRAAQGALHRPMERINVEPPRGLDRTLDEVATRSLVGSDISPDAGANIDPRELMTPVYVTIYAVQLDPSLPDETAPPDPFEEAIGIVQGLVVDALSGEALAGATVRLDLADGEPLIITTDASGAYVLPVPDVPDVIAVSASMADYAPETINVTKRELRRRTLRRDFRLMPERSDIVVIEHDPEVHHLGDDQYSGRANSQFQKRSEGRTYIGSFELTRNQLDPAADEVTLHLLARGTERNNEIRINGELIDEPLNHAPRDGSYGPFRATFPVDWLRPGRNEISIMSVYNTPSDLDDFEFVNIRLDLSSGNTRGE